MTEPEVQSTEDVKEPVGEAPVKKTPAKKPSTPKPSTAKVQADNVEVEPKVEAVKPEVPVVEPKVSLVQEIEADVEKVAKEAKQAVESEVAKIEENVDEEVAALKRLTVPELRQMHQDALLLESNAKRALYNARLRFANATTEVDDTMERDVAVGRIRVEEAVAWVVKLEEALKGEYKDIVGVAKFGGRH